MFHPANEEAKQFVNQQWRDHVIHVAAHTGTPLHKVRVLIMDAMGPKQVPRTALHMAEGGIYPENMVVVSKSPPEAAAMREAVEDTPLRQVTVLELDLVSDTVPGTYDLIILDTMSGIPKTMEMMRNARGCMAPHAVCIVGITRSHNQTPLPHGRWEKILKTIRGDDTLMCSLEREVNIQWLQHLLQQTMGRQAGFFPFWPMWRSMAEASYRPHQTMVYMPFALPPPRQEMPKRWEHKGIPLLVGDSKMVAEKALVFRRLKAARRRKRKQKNRSVSMKPFCSGPRKKVSERWEYEGKRRCTYRTCTK